MGKVTPVETVIDITNPNILWNYIPGFNGYEISYEINAVRSMKHYLRYPYGILIKPRKRSNIADPSYELSNNNNERVVVRLSQLIILAKTNPWGVNGYPRRTIITNPSSRNQKIFVNKTPNLPLTDNRKKFYPKFTVIEDKDDPNLYPVSPVYQSPIVYLDGSNDYGRENN